MDQQGQENISRQRRAAVRTALVLGIIAFLIFITFILSGVLGT